MSHRFRRARTHKRSSNARRNRDLRVEKLEQREVLSGLGVLTGLLAGGLGAVDVSHFAVGASVPSKGAMPSFTKQPTVNGSSSSVVYGKTASISVSGTEVNGQSVLSYAWQVVSTPSGGTAKFSANNSATANNTTITFSSCGVYTFTSTITDASGKSVQSTFSVTVGAVVTSVTVFSGDGKTALNTTSPYAVSTATQNVLATAYDQFGKIITSGATWKWSTSSANASVQSTTGTAQYKFTAAGKVTGSVSAVGGTGSPISLTFAFNVSAIPTSVRVTQTVPGNVTSTTAAFTNGGIYDQFGHALTLNATYSWSAVTVPTGAAACTFSTSGATTTVTFKAAGAYVVRLTAMAGSVTVTATETVTVVATPMKISSAPASLTVTGNTASLPMAVVVDQFGNPATGSLPAKWTVKQAPSGVAAVTISGSTATFGAAGAYVFTNTLATGLSYDVSVKVNQTVKTVTLTPKITTIQASGTQQFSAQAVDQFGAAMNVTVTWTATGGTVSAAGLFTAPSTAGNVTVSASAGSVKTDDVVSVTAGSNGGGGGANFLGLADSSLATLVKSLDTDGSISRADMLAIFTSLETSTTLSSVDFSDLKIILADAVQLSMPNYVQVLSTDVVLGNTANATFNGAALGNLAAGSTSQKLTNLVSKWFLGTDLPTSSYTYAKASGSLFPTTPSHADEHQGQLGDCYFISTLGMIADQNPTAIQNMFIDNGDGTFTVRFYTGSYSQSYNADGSYSDGFTGGKATADYVTVNLMLPSSGGTFAYSDYGQSLSSTSNSLWLPLAEKAYAEWNQTGKENRNNTNTFSGMEGGWMGTVDAQVLGTNASDYFGLSSSNAQAAINAINAHVPVTIGTNSSNVSNGLYSSHAYGIVGYNAANQTFTLYNPWGFSQPGALTWAQLEANCDGFCIAGSALSANRASAAPAIKVSAALTVVPSIVSSSVDVASAAQALATITAESTVVPAAGGDVVAAPAESVASLFNSAGAAAAAASQQTDSVLDVRSVDAVFQNVELLDLLSV